MVSSFFPFTLSVFNSNIKQYQNLMSPYSVSSRVILKIKHGNKVMLWVICYHFHNLKIVKNTHWGVLLLVNCRLLKVTLFHGCFSRLLSCTNGNKSRKTSQIYSSVLTVSDQAFTFLVIFLSFDLPYQFNFKD